MARKKNGRALEAAAPSGVRSSKRRTKVALVAEVENMEASFNCHLFVIAATVKQTSSPNFNSSGASLRPLRLNLLQCAQRFVHEEQQTLDEHLTKWEGFTAMGCDTDEVSSDCAKLTVSYQRKLTCLNMAVGEEALWQEESTHELGQRLGNVHDIVKSGLDGCIGHFTSTSAERAVEMYARTHSKESALKEHTEAKGKAVALPPAETSFVTPDCAGSSRAVFSPPPPRKMGRFSDCAPSGCRRSARLSAAPEPQPSHAAPEPASEVGGWAELFNRVPTEELLKALSLADSMQGKHTIRSAALVCSNWCQPLGDTVRSLKPNLAHVRAENLVRRFPTITCLQISGPVFPQDLSVLGAAYGAKLTSLSLSHVNLESVHLPFLVRFRALHSLDLSECALLKAADLATLGSFAGGLTKLSLAECLQLDDTAVSAFVRKMPGLKDLDLSGCRKLTNASLNSLLSLPSLTSLSLENCHDIDGAGLASLAKLTMLRSLNLLGLNKVTDAAVLQLKGLTALRSLSFGSEQVMGSAVGVVMGMQDLESLSLRGCFRMATNSLSKYWDLAQHADFMRPLQRLHTLDLTLCKNIGTSLAWSQFAKMPALTSLNLSFTKGAMGVEEWLVPGRVTGLTNLNLEECNGMSEKALDALVVYADGLNRPGMRLNLRGCGSMSFYALRALSDCGVILQ